MVHGVEHNPVVWVPYDAAPAADQQATQVDSLSVDGGHPPPTVTPVPAWAGPIVSGRRIVAHHDGTLVATATR